MRPYYPLSLVPGLKDQVFRDPPAEYRGMTFWSWNGKLERSQLLQQMDDQIAMGMGAFQPHARTGLDTAYLGVEWFDHYRAVVAKAAATGHRVWIYDEDRWPSGYAGGLATADPARRARHLRFAREQGSAADAEGDELARYAIVQNDEGRMVSCQRLAAGAPVPPFAETWSVRVHVASPSAWYNGTAYLNTLDPQAVQGFIDCTHERYAASLGSDLGATVAAFFTDEPLLTGFSPLTAARPGAPPGAPGGGRGAVSFPPARLLPGSPPRTAARPGASARPGTCAWTGDLPETFAQAYGLDLLDRLPEVFLDRADGAHAELRWRFFDHLAERFRQAFHRRIGDWCQAKGVISSGHLMGEDSLASQQSSLGEAMRHYRHYHLPGIDSLKDAYQPLTAKQVQSVARQDGRAGVMSEIYGVSDWQFSASGFKRWGDWQAALGVTTRVLHLAWYTMAGHAKRDYPPCLDRRLPWWREFRLIEDHFARVAAVMTRGTPICRVAILHPIESQWVLAGPVASSRDATAALESCLQQVLADLLHGLIDTDLIAESLLAEQDRASGQQPAGARLTVGAMAYEAVILPRLTTIRSSTLDHLETFAAAGGRVVAIDRLPALVDGRPSQRALKLPARIIPLTRHGLLAAVEDLREVDLVTDDGGDLADCLHQLRQDGDQRHLFLCATRTGHQPAFWEPWHPRWVTVRVRGHWTVTANDTQDGQRRPLDHCHADAWTEFRWLAAMAGSLCATLAPLGDAPRHLAPLPAAPRWRRLANLDEPLAVERDEPNVLVLSLAEARLDDGPWLPRTEVGRAENLLRAQAGLPRRSSHGCQPWAMPVSIPRHRASLRFIIDCATAQTGLRLACEGSPEITLDGQRIEAAADGCWIDPCLATRPLPNLDAGHHELVMTFPLAVEKTLEWAYILGGFAVALSGSRARLGALENRWTWGDLGRQGLPFYGGNATYRCRFTAPGGPIRLAVPWFEAPLLAVELDGARVGRIAFAPFRLDLGPIAAGIHDLALTAFGHRRNHLGALHCRQPGPMLCYPDTFERGDDTEVAAWQVMPTGIVAAPFIEVPA